MRRTNEAFKAELEKRCCAYRRERARKRRNLLTAALCVGICCVAAAIFDPFGARSEAPQAADMLADGGLKSESAMSQQKDGTVTRFPQVTQWEYCFSEAAPVEDEAAPMAPETNMSTTDEPAEEPREEAGEPAAVTVICGNEQITLDAADSAVIMDYLCSDRWIMSAANCLCDYTLEVNGETYRYHSACGTVQNDDGQSLTLSEKDKAIFNDIVSRCPMRIE